MDKNMVDFFTVFSGVPEINIVDIGALPLSNNNPNPYHNMVNTGKAKVFGFEPDKEGCKKLNLLYGEKGRFYPHFVGNGKKAVFYETNYPMTGSLYKPDKELMDKFYDLSEYTQLIAEHDVETKRLDDIEELDDIDFIKIDVQGSELEIFRNAPEVLSDVCLIWTEVWYLPVYEKQPLFCDVDKFLNEQGFSLHTFTTATRQFKAVDRAEEKSKYNSHQVIWGDAIYIRDFTKLNELSFEKLIKMAALVHELIGSFDLCLVILENIDKKIGTNLVGKYKKAFS